MDDFEDIANVLLLGAVDEVELVAEGIERRYYHRENAFLLSETMFIRKFRLNKQTTENLIAVLTPFLNAPTRASAINIPTKVLIALRFYAGGCYQVDVASNIHAAVSQSTVSRCIKEVSEALNNPEIMDHWIQFPNEMLELERIRNEFYREHGFPGVIGCMDCTHVAIVPPHTDEHVYVNRKRYHSINVQLICDNRMKIMNVNARYPGSSHDSFIWNNSVVQQVLVNFYRQVRGAFYLLGDSRYPLRPWLLTPLEDEPPPNTPEAAYNSSHKTTRSLIERCNGVLKMHFRCLLKHRVLHYSPTMSSKIINACVVLHNMCIENNVPLPDFPDEEVEEFGLMDNENGLDVERVIGRVNPDLPEGCRLRRRTILSHFQ